jgi:transcription elongation factor GreB
VSKAFTKEGEDEPELRPQISEWPRGIKNYLTPAGHAALKREIEALREAPRGDARARLHTDERMKALLSRLEAAEVIEPTPAGVVRFGARVTVEDEEGAIRRYQIVGVDEADPKNGLVSWRAPIAAALMGRRVGDSVTLHTPSGDEELTVVEIA